MGKFTTKQLQDALIELRKKKDPDAQAAYRMVFDEVAERMGDERFDEWMDELGW